MFSNIRTKINRNTNNSSPAASWESKMFFALGLAGFAGSCYIFCNNENVIIKKEYITIEKDIVASNFEKKFSNNCFKICI